MFVEKRIYPRYFSLLPFTSPLTPLQLERGNDLTLYPSLPHPQPFPKWRREIKERDLKNKCQNKTPAG
jgi:hypothetical protein